MMYTRYTPRDGGGWEVQGTNGRLATITGEPGRWVVIPMPGIGPGILPGIGRFLSRQHDDSHAWLERLYRLPDARI